MDPRKLEELTTISKDECTEKNGMVAKKPVNSGEVLQVSGNPISNYVLDHNNLGYPG